MNAKLGLRNLIPTLFGVLLRGVRHTQTFKTFASENFGIGTGDPSARPAAKISPETTDDIGQVTWSELSDGRYAMVLNQLG